METPNERKLGGRRLFVAAMVAGVLSAACSNDPEESKSEGSGGGAATGGSGVGGSGGGTSGTGGGGGSAGQPIDLGGLTPPEAGLKIAFFGDQGLGGPSRQALELIKREGADFVLHLGDFDYDDNPAAWEQLMNDGLGPDYPWFAVVGNHDTDAWDGYSDVIQRKLSTIGDAECTGEPGVKHACTYRGVHFMLSGVGLLGTGHEEFLRDELEASEHVWKICGWHMNQQDMQLGEKSDATGWGVFQECQKAGAMVINGHEHSYSRTLTLTDIGNEAQGHGALSEFNFITLSPGRTFVVVNGAGGQGLRSYKSDLHDDDTWWANMYTTNWEFRDGNGGTAFNLLDPSGVAFLEFGIGGDPRRVRGYYKTAIMDRTVDEFEVRVDLGN